MRSFVACVSSPLSFLLTAKPAGKRLTKLNTPTWTSTWAPALSASCRTITMRSNRGFSAFKAHVLPACTSLAACSLREPIPLLRSPTLSLITGECTILLQTSAPTNSGILPSTTAVPIFTIFLACQYHASAMPAGPHMRSPPIMLQRLLAPWAFSFSLPAKRPSTDSSACETYWRRYTASGEHGCNT